MKLRLTSSKTFHDYYYSKIFVKIYTWMSVAPKSASYRVSYIPT